MSGLPLIIVCGGDDLALRVCQELCGTRGHRVALLWHHSADMAAKVKACGASYFGLGPNDFDALRTAGAHEAASIMALSEDDRLNLQIALKARDLNPDIRLVLRQFNRTLGRKLQQNLTDCSVLSLASQAAGTYAGAAIDPSCVYAIQFPDIDGPLVGFCERTASDFEVAGLTVAEAQERLGCRVLDLYGRASEPLLPGDRIVAFGEMTALASSAERPREHPPAERRSRLSILKRAVARVLRRGDPILGGIVLAILMVFVGATLYFAHALHVDFIKAAYFVAATMTTVGYGDVTPGDKGTLPIVAAMILMVCGVTLSGIVIAFATSALTRAQWVAMQGLRRIRARDHVIVCGSGTVGSSVIEFLMSVGKHVVVVEHKPDPLTVERAREQSFDLLTGDASRDSTLELCNVRYASSLVALTDDDTANLEVALAARAAHPNLPIVMRIADPLFARSIARHFEITQTYSTAELAAPAFAGLSRFPGGRGRFRIGEEDYTIVERVQGEVLAPSRAERRLPLCRWRDGALTMIDSFDELEARDEFLFLVPLSQFRSTESEAFAARDIAHTAEVT